MEIKRINEESYESIRGYIDIMLSIIPRLNDLCFVDYEGTRYMLSFFEDKFGIVQNENGDLNPFSFEHDGDKNIFDSEEYHYEIFDVNGLKEVLRTNRLNQNSERLSFMPRIENYPRDIVDYVQYIDSLNSCITFSYDVTSRNGNLDSVLSFINFHRPDVIQVDVLKKILFFYKKVTYHYALGLNDDFYYQPLIAINNLLLGTKRVRFASSSFVSELSNKGFNKTIPKELTSIIRDDNCDYTRIKKITSEYKSFIKSK